MVKLGVRVLLVLLATSCLLVAHEPTVQISPYIGFIPEHAVLIHRPKAYGRWWKEISDCAKLGSGHLRQIRIFAVGDSSATNFPCPVAYACWGWHRPHEIYLAFNKVNDSLVVEHEMLHEIVYMSGVYESAEGPHNKYFKICKDHVS